MLRQVVLSRLLTQQHQELLAVLSGDIEDAMARKKPRCFQILMDFANLFKAFIGVNYLSIAFAISQSGIGLGIIGLLLISTATVHCCHLIIKCKRELIRQIIEDNISSEHQLSETLTKTRHLLNTTLEKQLSYGDIASMSLGKVGIILVNVSLVITQFGFCVNYFIFLGNTFQKMFPYHLPYIEVNESNTTTPIPSTVDVTTDKERFSITNSSSPVVNILPYSFVSQSPGYNILVLIPLPIFILFGYLRSIRQLGPASVFANLSSLVGYIVMMVYILSDFSVSDTISWFKFSTFPIFFGQVTASFEGIGTIVPIESSMEGNHHLFPHLLYLVVLLFTCVLASMGFLSYLRLGTSTAQVIIWNLQPNSMLQLIVSLVVCIGVVFTFPLQCFPVIEIFEHLIFAPGKVCGPPKTNSSSCNHNEDEADTLHDSDLHVHVDAAIAGSKEDEELCYLLQDPQAAKCLSSLPVATEIPKSVWTVKRNILRTLIVVAQLGTAYAFKDEFAYITSFTGAIGSTMIAYIIPSLIHLKLKRHDLGMMIICKDILLIVFGLVGGVSGVYASVRSIIVDFQ